MKETKNINLEHKNHRQPLKNVHHNAPFIQQGFYKPMGISGDTLREALLATSGNIRKHCRRKSRVKRTIICY
jgi:hypothetical protein